MSTTWQTILHYVFGTVAAALVVALAYPGHVITGAQALAFVGVIVGLLLGTGATTVGANQATPTVPPVAPQPAVAAADPVPLAAVPPAHATTLP